MRPDQKGKTRQLVEERLRRRYSQIDFTAKDLDLGVLTYKELRELLAENVRPEVKSLEVRVKTVLENRFINVKIRRHWLTKLLDYSKKQGYSGERELLDDILAVWYEKVRFGRGWKT